MFTCRRSEIHDLSQKSIIFFFLTTNTFHLIITVNERVLCKIINKKNMSVFHKQVTLHVVRIWLRNWLANLPWNRNKSTELQMSHMSQTDMILWKRHFSPHNFRRDTWRNLWSSGSHGYFDSQQNGTAIDVSAKIVSYSCFYWNKYDCTWGTKVHSGC